MDVSLYLNFFKLRSFDAIVDIFHDTLIDTNGGISFLSIGKKSNEM